MLTIPAAAKLSLYLNNNKIQTHKLFLAVIGSNWGQNFNVRVEHR